MNTILGISAFYHDSAAALILDGEIIAAAQEERFTRKKHDPSFPVNAVKYCLAEAEKKGCKLDCVAFYEKPISKFSRILETYFNVAPTGLRSFVMAMPLWLRHKLWIPMRIEASLKRLGCDYQGKLYFPEHHVSHAASAFFPSPFEEATVLTLDGVGEWGTSTIGHGSGSKLRILKEMRFPHSLGLLYSAFTYYTGFKVNSGEYKLMGLAPYGEPVYRDLILENLLDLKQDGSFRLNLEYFGFLDSLTMTNSRFDTLFSGPPRTAEKEITKREMNLASSIQAVTEEVVLRQARYAHNLTGCKYACLAGGVALNCVANGRLLREGPFEDIWVQPAAGDAGGALGAALAIWHMVRDGERKVHNGRDAMQGSYCGPSFSEQEIQQFLQMHGYPAEFMPDPALRSRRIAELIAKEKVLGLFQGRMEFGPRALGNRSIIGDARSSSMQSTMNKKIKYRESFRPFAPSCLEERAVDYFELDRPSPYMLLVAGVQKHRLIRTNDQTDLKMHEKINQSRSDIPAITHVDNSARIQTVNRETNPAYYDIIKAMEDLTGYGIIINTSFNVRGEPIVCTPEDAYRCFMRTEMDFLILESYILCKKDQPVWIETGDWRKDFVLD